MAFQSSETGEGIVFLSWILSSIRFRLFCHDNVDTEIRLLTDEAADDDVDMVTIHLARLAFA